MNRLKRSSGPRRTTRIAVILVTTAIGACLPLVAQGQQTGTTETSEYSNSSEKTFTVKLKPPEQTPYCKASTTTEYYQSDDVAEVNVIITNPDCAASSGSFVMRVRYRTEDSEVVNIEFDETWQREDDQDILFNRQYPIGKNVDLVRVRAAKMRCVCADDENENENENQQ